MSCCLDMSYATPHSTILEPGMLLEIFILILIIAKIIESSS